MHIVNPSGVKFTNKHLSWFRCLGLEDHGFGGAANGGKKAASNVELPGNSDHNFSKSPAEMQSIPFIRLMLYGGLKVLPNSRLSGHNPKYYSLLMILAVCKFLCLIATIIK
jgi:hypothetical protein